MTHTTQATRVSNVSRTLAQARLGVPSVFFFAAAGAASLTVVADGATTGTLGIPVSYFAIAIVLAVFSVGYVAMSPHIVNAGAAIWYPRVNPGPEPAEYAARLASACGPWLDRFQMIDNTFAKHHVNGPHHYLGFIGVATTRQGTGLGSRLLDRHHAFFDAHGIPAYLEASNESNHRLYQRHGYADLPGSPFHLPDTGPPIWAMRRDPLLLPGGMP